MPQYKGSRNSFYHWRLKLRQQHRTLYLDTRAVHQASSGDVTTAIATLEQALSDPPVAAPLIDEFTTRLALFQQQKPYLLPAAEKDKTPQER